MLNQMILVGRIVDLPEIKETSDGKKVTNITIAIPRNFKNQEGVYETDFIECTLWGNMACNTSEYCHKGDIVGIKGRVQTDTYEHDGQRKKSFSVIAEKITFLSKRYDKDQNNEHEEDLEEDMDR